LTTNKFKKNIFIYAKFLVAAVLLTFIFLKVDFTQFIQKLKLMNWWYFLLALSLHWIVVLIGTHRLQILLHAQKVSLGFWLTFKYNCIGYFFNLFSLGSTGGDVVKSYYVSRETDTKKTESVTVVFLDRIMGMTAVLIIAACAILATMWKDDSFRPLLPAVLLLLFGGAAGVCVIFTKNWWTRFIKFSTLQKAGVFTMLANKIQAILLRIIDALHNYKEHKWTAVIAMLESIFLQLIMCVIGWCYGTGLGFNIPFYAYFIVFPIGTLILSLPISPSGLGTGELSFIWCFSRFGIKEDTGLAFAFTLLLRLSMLSLSSVGFIMWMLPGTHITRKELEEKAEEIENNIEAEQINYNKNISNNG